MQCTSCEAYFMLAIYTFWDFKSNWNSFNLKPSPPFYCVFKRLERNLKSFLPFLLPFSSFSPTLLLSPSLPLSMQLQRRRLQHVSASSSAWFARSLARSPARSFSFAGARLFSSFSRRQSVPCQGRCGKQDYRRTTYYGDHPWCGR